MCGVDFKRDNTRLVFLCGSCTLSPFAVIDRSAMTDGEAELLKYDRFDFEKFSGRQEGGAAKIEVAATNTLAPVSSSWLAWHVKLPSRLALVTLVCILVYEVLVGVSMQVRKLRWVMVNWLMYLLLGINVCLLCALGVLVLVARMEISFGRVSRLADVE